MQRHTEGEGPEDGEDAELVGDERGNKQRAEQQREEAGREGLGLMVRALVCARP
jgi:hypothetical protein